MPAAQQLGQEPVHRAPSSAVPPGLLGGSGPEAQPGDKGSFMWAVDPAWSLLPLPANSQGFQRLRATFSFLWARLLGWQATLNPTVSKSKEQAF